ncbi:hypothetical protein [Billgrantia montanilacus]|uniref:Uncharacterized protein n=1 Tax=Billgrantia montanilacus TaxID=2282305 RepID=A0A368TRH1_9GAMM|nr:hypothetical protein [Halomonas montanilacus]RCV87208.1 hypothetical protein DU505_18250 [Halomonas montanilacus]
MSQNSDRTPSPRRLRVRLLVWLLPSLLLLVLLTQLGTNILLNTAAAQSWIDRRLPHVTVTWSAGWSLWPGQLNLQNLTIEVHATELPLYLAVDEAEVRVATSGLVVRRLTLHQLDAHGIRLLRMGPHRLQGEGELRATGLELAAPRVGAESFRLALEAGSLWRDDTLLADDLTLDAALSVVPFDPAPGLDRQILSQVSGRLSLAGRADAWVVFNPYLRATPWLTLDGSGGLTAELSLHDGLLEAGSHVTLESPDLAVELVEAALVGSERGSGTRQRLSGRGQASLEVRAGETTSQPYLDVTLEDVAMHTLEPAEGGPLLTSRLFAISARLESADLSSPPAPPDSARMTWQEAEVPDVSRLSRHLPPGLPLTLHAGTARLDAWLDYREGRLEGQAELSGNDIAMTLMAQSLVGELALGMNLAELDPAASRLDLSGSRLTVAATQTGTANPMVTELTFPQARFTVQEPLTQSHAHKGPTLLDGELTVVGQVSHLAFLDAFLEDAFDGRGMALNGAGRLFADIRFREGRPVAGGRVTVAASSLETRFLDFHAQGQGSLVARLLDASEGPAAELQLRLEQARLTRGEGTSPMLVAPLLNLTAAIDTLTREHVSGNITLRLAWPEAVVPDVAVLGRHFPDSSPLRLLGGSATSRGELTFDASGVRGQVALNGQALQTSLLDTEVQGALSLELPLRHASLDGAVLDLSGSRFTLEMEGGDEEERMTTRLLARQARFTQPFGDNGQTPRTRLVLDGSVDRLGFLDRLLPRTHGVTLRGAGQLQADLDLVGHEPQPGSRVRVDADRLAATFLDYGVNGNGWLEALVEGNPAAPSARLVLNLPRVSLGRRGATTDYLSGRHFRLETTLPRFTIDPDTIPVDALTTRIELPIAEVADIAIYDDYLPRGAGLSLLGGSASLTADLRLEGLHARGDMTLRAFNTDLRIGEQQLRGDLSLDARLREGNLETLTFDAAGTRLRLDNVSREGAEGRRERGWWAQLDLERGRLTWQQPLSLSARLGLTMRDTGLLANLMLSRTSEQPRLARLLTVSAVSGHADVELTNNRLHLSDLRLTGRNLEMLADLRLAEDTMQGELYARFGALRLGLALENGGRDLQLFRPRRWYRSVEEARSEADVRQPLQPGWQQEIEGVTASDPR